MPTLDEDIQDQADLTDEEKRLLERMRQDQSTADAPAASDNRQRLQEIADKFGITLPSASVQTRESAAQGPIGGPADPAAAIERATYSPSAPDIGALPRGTGVAVGPAGYVTGGPVPQSATAGLQAAGIPQIAAMDAPPPPDPAQAEIARLQSAVADAAAAAARTDLGPQSQQISLQHLKQAQDAVKQARIFQGRQAFNRAVQNGTPPEQALALYYSDLFPTDSGEPNAPSAAMLNAVRPETPTPPPQWVPDSPLTGQGHWESNGKITLPSTAAGGLTPYQQENMDLRRQTGDATQKNRRIDQLQKALKDDLEGKAYAATPDAKLTPEQRTIRDRFLKNRQEYDQLTSGEDAGVANVQPTASAQTSTATTANKIRVRDKKTGKTGYWTGGKPPSDQYEILK